MRFGKRSENLIEKKIIEGHSFDYNIHLVTKNFQPKNNIKRNYALFLESPTPIFTGDANLEGINKDDKMTVKGWTNSLDKFFSFIENELNLEILISPHPKPHIRVIPQITIWKKNIKRFVVSSRKPNY